MEKILSYLSYYLRSLIPLVGDDVFFVEEDNKKLSLKKYVIERMFHDFSQVTELLNGKEEFGKMTNGEYYDVSVLRRAFKEIDFKIEYENIVNSVKDKIQIHSSVLAYIKAIKPRLILTTSPFGILDDLIPEYNSLWFYPTEESNFSNISNPSICHIFGQAGRCEVKWVVGEEELLDFLHGWNNGKSLDKSFTARFQEKGLLVLGCDSLADWIFRFLWYPLGKYSKEKGKGFLLGCKDNSIYDDNTPNNFSTNICGKLQRNGNIPFEEFLKRINYEKSENMYRILDAAVEMIKQDTSEQSSNTHDFFISYASEDFTLASVIKERLTKEGLDVWLDKDRPEDLDGKYWAGIDRAIENSRFIMPIVTKNYVERFFSKRRLKDNKITALEEETSRFISALLARYNDDEEKMLSRIIPVLHLGEKVTIFHRNKEIEEDLNTDNIDKYSNLSNPCFWIYNQMNFKFYSDNDSENCTFCTTNWSNYKGK